VDKRRKEAVAAEQAVAGGRRLNADPRGFKIARAFFCDGNDELRHACDKKGPWPFFPEGYFFGRRHELEPGFQRTSLLRQAFLPRPRGRTFRRPCRWRPLVCAALPLSF